MHLESTLALKERRPSPGVLPHAVQHQHSAPSAPNANAPRAMPRAPASSEHRRSLKMNLKGGKGVKGRAPALGEVGKRQTLNVFAADGRDVSAEVGSEEAVVDETAFVKQPSVIFTRGKKGMFYTLLLLDYQKDEDCAPHHRLHWLITDIPGEEFSSGKLSDGCVLADFEPPRLPGAHQPRLYVLMVFEQRPATPPTTPDGQPGQPDDHQGPLGQHPDLQQFLGDRQSFPLTAWLRSNNPKMARIAACQQFRAHLADNLALLPGLHDGLDQQKEDQGILGDVDDSEHSADERPAGVHDDVHDKENQAAASRKSKRSKLNRLRRLLRMKQRCPV